MDWIYWSIAVWPIGYFFSVPVGGLLYNYFGFVAMWNFIEMFYGKGTFDEFLNYPFRHAVVGSFIFFLALTFGSIPILGIFTSWGCLLWAKYDYLDYQDTRAESSLV